MGWDVFGEGIVELGEQLAKWASMADQPNEILEVAADAFVRDLKALPKPRSRINAAGRTHLIDSFSYESDQSGVYVGWGVPYGPYVEHGQHPHKGMRAQPHFRPTWKQNESRYVRLVQQYINLL